MPEMGRGLGKGLREFKDSVSGDHKDTLEVPEELTATPIIAEPVQVEAERNVA